MSQKSRYGNFAVQQSLTEQAKAGLVTPDQITDVREGSNQHNAQRSPKPSALTDRALQFAKTLEGVCCPRTIPTWRPPSQRKT